MCSKALLMCCCSHVGTCLGGFDSNRVPELNLPAFPSAPDAVEPAAGVVRKAASEDAKGPRKFMLGVNSPVVPARIVKRILHCDFGVMAELSSENLELEKRRSGEGEDAKSASRGKLDLLAWVRAFTLYTGVVLSAYPDKGMELAAYQAMILHGADSCEWMTHSSVSNSRTWRRPTSPEWTRRCTPGLCVRPVPRRASGRPHLLTLSTPLHPEARGGGPKCAMPGMTGKSAQCFCAAMHICVPSAGGDHRRSACVPANDYPGGTTD